jgi:hypothetical protein
MAGQFSALTFLGTAANGSQRNRTFTVKYSDRSSDTFTVDLSDWQARRATAASRWLPRWGTTTPRTAARRT